MPWPFSRKKNAGPNDHTKVACSGDCFRVKGVEIGLREADPIEAHDPRHAEHQLSHRDLARQLYTTGLKPWQTRLIRLHDERANEPLTMDLVTANLFGSEGIILEEEESKVEYKALSYTWGSSDCNNRIICNGVEYLITESLDSVLRRLRRSKVGLYLWADALCINQHNKNEKSRQVREMLNIYRRASNVLVWLGSQILDSNLAIACIQNINEYRAAVRETRRHTESCITRLVAMHRALLGLYNRTWTRRTWVRQEIYAARRITVLCGSNESELDWTLFDAGCLLLQDIESQLTAQGQLTIQDIQSTTCLARIRELSAGVRPSQSIISPGPRDFFELLMRSHLFQATNARDFIYSTLGMAGVPTETAGDLRADIDIKIQIDYSKTTPQVYQDAVRFIVLFDKTPRSVAKIFHHYVRRPNRLEGLPTWTMDWNTSSYPSNESKVIEGLPSSFFPAQSSAWSMPLQQEHCPIAFPELCNKNPDGGYGWLEVTGRIMNVIERVSDLTCDLERFVSGGKYLRNGNWSDIRRRDWDEFPASFRLFEQYKRTGRRSPPWCPVVPFDSTKHDRRLAILAVPQETYLALVPATAEPGDLVVGISSDVLPLVFRSVVRIERPAPSSLMKSSGELNKAARKNRALLQQVGNCNRGVGGIYEYHGLAFHKGDNKEFLIEEGKGSNKLWAMPEEKFVLI